MTEEELQRWLMAHGGYAGKKENYQTIPGYEDRRGNRVAAERRLESVTYTASDGASITVREQPGPVAGTAGPSLAEAGTIYDVVGEEPPDRTRQAATRTPEQVRNDAATAQQNEMENAAKEREQNERSWNQSSPGGSGLPETHLERATREAKERQEAETRRRQDEDRERQLRAEEARAREQQADRESREREGAASRGMTQQQIDLQREEAEARRNRPEFLTPNTTAPNITRYDPATGQIISDPNPNYDAVKAAAEEERERIKTQIMQRQMSLEEGKQAYTQWFDANVRTPLMQSQEMRARAEERRQALEAEERRRQFAADYKLRKATLGEQASQRATSAEISLLPYRSGPTWGEDFSNAVNSLAQGGRMDTNASAGINFRESSFAFNRPDFAKIAKQAAKAVLSGLTDYRPSDQEFETGDYSGIPSVGGATFPGYSYQGAALPAPSPGAELPPE